MKLKNSSFINYFRAFLSLVNFFNVCFTSVSTVLNFTDNVYVEPRYIFFLPTPVEMRFWNSVRYNYFRYKFGGSPILGLTEIQMQKGAISNERKLSKNLLKWKLFQFICKIGENIFFGKIFFSVRFAQPVFTLLKKFHVWLSYFVFSSANLHSEILNV